MNDKNQALINFLKTCPYISTAKMFFNFGNIENDAFQAMARTDDVALQTPYVDGSVLKRFTMSIDSFKSVAYNPVIANYTDENVDDLQSVQTILDWINDQDDIRNYPNFGQNCFIEKMETLTNNPDLVSVDTSLNPPVAIYRISIQIDYIDNSKKLWT